MIDSKKFCVLGNAMNASQMNLDEDISPSQVWVSLIGLTLILALFFV